MTDGTTHDAYGSPGAEQRANMDYRNCVIGWPARSRLDGVGAIATAIVVADMVGVGVFTSLGFQVQAIPSGFALLGVWTVGGIVALCGVFS